MPVPKEPFHVSLLVLPEAMVFPVSGIYEVLTALDGLSRLDSAVPPQAPFEVEIVTVPGAVSVARLPLGAPGPSIRSSGRISSSSP
jgi:hypothetical protein